MPRDRMLRSSTLLAVGALVGAVLGALFGIPVAAAAPGTWGAGRYPYADGVVCRSGALSSPLAAWTVSGGHRAYLTQAVHSDGRTDTAAPPLPTAGTPAAPVPVGVGGEFGSQQEIAALAYLLSTGGDAATLATAVFAQTDPSGMPSCADTGTAYNRLAAARQAAGPYQVTVSPPAGKARPGTPAAVSATVRTTAGAPVPGAKVTFSASGVQFAAPTVTTDAAGVARAAATVQSGALAAIPITATAAVSTGLLEATIAATPTATNPTGATVPAIYPTPPTSYTGQAVLAVDQTAHPVVSTALSTHLFAAQAPFTPRAAISGLNGHTADVTFDLIGPLALKDRTLCAGIPATQWARSDLHSAATSRVTVTGDGTAQGGALTPPGPGCYAVKTALATVDAAPAVSKTAPLAVVAVLDTAVSRQDTEPAVFATAGSGTAKLTGSLRVTDTHGLAGKVQVTLTGPIRPLDGNCGADAKQWPNAARAVRPATVQSTESTGTAVVGAGTYDYTVAAPTATGCYRARPALTLTAPGGDTLTVATADDRAAFVLDPTVTAAVERTSAVSPASVPVQVEVDGLYGLAAHVRTSMYVAAADPGGCDRASFVHAVRAATGPAAEVPAQPGPVTVSVESGATPQLGCYVVVPEVTLDADPHVRIAGTLTDAGATLIAGLDPNKPLHAAARGGGSGTSVPFLVAIGVLAAAILGVVARVALTAWRGRDGPPEERWRTFDDTDPFELTGGGLPSGT